MDDFGLLVGAYNSTLPTITDGDYSELQLDSSGRLIIRGQFDEDSAHTSSDPGLHILAVRNDTEGSLVDTDGDYAPLQVDSSGRLRVIADVDVGIDAEKAEDSAHTSTDIGNFMLAVRRDTKSSGVDADGDYASLNVDADGDLYVSDTVAQSSLSSIDSSLSSIDSEIQSITQAEDAAHSSGDTGVMALVVRQDTKASTADTDGDYAALIQDADGDLYVTDTVAQGHLSDISTDTGNIDTSLNNIEADIAALEKAEDSAHSSGDSGIMSLAVRADSDGSLADTDGDYAPLQVDSNGKLKTASEPAPVGSESYNASDDLADSGDGLISVTTSYTDVCSIAHTSGTAYVYGWQWAADKNAEARLVTDTSGTIVVYKLSVNSSAKPGECEHWSEGGRIEIPGAAGRNIKVQVRGRGASANATGSIHARI